MPSLSVFFHWKLDAALLFYLAALFLKWITIQFGRVKTLNWMVLFGWMMLCKVHQR